MGKKTIRHAFLVMAHNNIEQLNLLLETLDSDQGDIFLHIDTKSKIVEADTLPLRWSKVFFYKQISVYWADYSQIQCELFLLDQATKGKYKYYHLISGADFPLVATNEIVRRLNGDRRLFLHFATPDNVKHTYPYVRYYHLFQRRLYIVNRGKQFSLFKVINKLCIQGQKLFRVNRIAKDLEVRKGANWFSIPDDAARYVLTRKEWIQKQFAFTRSGDEFFMQTLFYNSKYKDRIYRLKEDDNYASCMRYIDWSRGNPYTFLMGDYEELINSKMLFARKFDWTADKDIIIRLCDELKQREAEEQSEGG